MQADLVVSIGGSTSGRAKYRRGMEYGDCLLHYYYIIIITQSYHHTCVNPYEPRHVISNNVEF